MSFEDLSKAFRGGLKGLSKTLKKTASDCRTILLSALPWVAGSGSAPVLSHQ